MSVDLLKVQLTYCQSVVQRHTEDISQEESARTPDSGGNSMNWELGHILVSRNAMLDLVGADPILNDEEKEAYGRGKKPGEGVEGYLPLATLRERHKESGERLMQGLRDLDPAKLNEKAPYSPFENPKETLGTLLGFFLFHEAYHTGQTGVVRRLLGKEGLIK